MVDIRPLTKSELKDYQRKQGAKNNMMSVSNIRKSRARTVRTPKEREPEIVMTLTREEMDRLAGDVVGP